MDGPDIFERVYGEILNRHRQAARRDGVGSESQERLFALANAYMAEFPEAVARWEARYPGNA